MGCVVSTTSGSLFQRKTQHLFIRTMGGGSSTQESLLSPRFNHRTVQLVLSSGYTDYAVPAAMSELLCIKFKPVAHHMFMDVADIVQSTGLKISNVL
jgi:hypothetical protein